MFSGSGYTGKKLFYAGGMGETSESCEYDSASLLHSERAVCTEKGIMQDKENSKRNFIYLFEL